MRAQVVLRPAKDADAEALVAIWGGVLRRGSDEERLEDARQVVDRVSATHRERIVVAEVDGSVVGAVHLEVTTMSPLNLEPVVRAVSPHVLPEFRRRGVGSALLDAAVGFAEELGIGQVATAVSAGARDSNRFMARLAFAPVAVLRMAPTTVVRSRLRAQRPGPGGPATRSLPRLLAARRSMRQRPQLESRGA